LKTSPVSPPKNALNTARSPELLAPIRVYARLNWLKVNTCPQLHINALVLHFSQLQSDPNPREVFLLLGPQV
jgi:hypothetical protein